MKSLDKLLNLRDKIDEVDSKLCELLQKRMELTDKVGKYKSEVSGKVYDNLREEQKLESIGKLCDKYPDEIKQIYKYIMQLSRYSQYKIITHGVEEDIDSLSIRLNIEYNRFSMFLNFLDMGELDYHINECISYDDYVSVDLMIVGKLKDIKVMAELLDTEF